MIRIILASMTLLSAIPASADPLIIAHRGASAERPEHSRAAYERAMEQGADFIEPDLVMTRDGVLIVRHENEISGTTDVADHPEFAPRRVTKVIDGQAVTGWFTEDFTLAELQTLRARERLPELRQANTAWDGQDVILTFEEVLVLAANASLRQGRRIGVAPELKHPTYFASLDLPMEDALVAVLTRHGLTGADAPVLIQCFEVGSLERLSARIDTPLLQLIAAGGGPIDTPGLSYNAMITPAGLAEIRRYAQWIGADAALIASRPSAPAPLVIDAHSAGLKVAVWTVRPENHFLPERFRQGADPARWGDQAGYVRALEASGVDAVFTDAPGAAR